MRRVIGKIAIGIFAIWMFTSIDNWRYDSIFLLMGVLALCWLGIERKTDKSDIEQFTGVVLEGFDFQPGEPVQIAISEEFLTVESDTNRFAILKE